MLRRCAACLVKPTNHKAVLYTNQNIGSLVSTTNQRLVL